MTSKVARQILSLRRPSGEDDDERDVRNALDQAGTDAELTADYQAQRVLDESLAEEAAALPLADGAPQQLAESVTALEGNGGGRNAVKNPATLAVGMGFLLLIAVLVWHFLGRVGTFPDEAIKIATVGNQASADQFDPVETKVGSLEDWFMLKGFDSFRAAPGFQAFDAVGVRIFKVENEPISQVAVPENLMFFYSFQGRPFGISVPPEKTWRVTEADRWVLAIREENGICFMVAFRGTKQDMEKLLKQREK